MKARAGSFVVVSFIGGKSSVIARITMINPPKKSSGPAAKSLIAPDVLERKLP
jgi:hypothetical protein